MFKLSLRRNNVVFLIVFVIGFFLVVIISYKLIACTNNNIVGKNQALSYYNSDIDIVEKSIEIWTRKTGSSKEMEMRERSTRVINVGNETCVGLYLNEGALGGSPVYCFNESTRNLTKSFDEVE